MILCTKGHGFPSQDLRYQKKRLVPLARPFGKNFLHWLQIRDLRVLISYQWQLGWPLLDMRKGSQIPLRVMAWQLQFRSPMLMLGWNHTIQFWLSLIHCKRWCLRRNSTCWQWGTLKKGSGNFGQDGKCFNRSTRSLVPIVAPLAGAFLLLFIATKGPHSKKKILWLFKCSLFWAGGLGIFGFPFLVVGDAGQSLWGTEQKQTFVAAHGPPFEGVEPTVLHRHILWRKGHVVFSSDSFERWLAGIGQDWHSFPDFRTLV